MLRWFISLPCRIIDVWGTGCCIRGSDGCISIQSVVLIGWQGTNDSADDFSHNLFCYFWKTAKFSVLVLLASHLFVFNIMIWAVGQVEGYQQARFIAEFVYKSQQLLGHFCTFCRHEQSTNRYVKVTHHAGRVLANSRPHQLRWGDCEMGTAISFTKCSQIASRIQKMGIRSPKASYLIFVQLSFVQLAIVITCCRCLTCVRTYARAPKLQMDKAWFEWDIYVMLKAMHA